MAKVNGKRVSVPMRSFLICWQQANSLDEVCQKLDEEGKKQNPVEDWGMTAMSAYMKANKLRKTLPQLRDHKLPKVASKGVHLSSVVDDAAFLATLGLEAVKPVKAEASNLADIVIEPPPAPKKAKGGKVLV